MKVLQINIFSCGHRANRFPFTVKMVNEILKINNIDKIKLCFHAEASIIELWKQYFTNNPKYKNIVTLYQYPNADYPSRVKIAQMSECKYSCKLDDDILISSHVWDYMIDNLDKINNKHPIIAPILTNGIPSVEMFVEDFLEKEDKQTAYSMFLNGHIPSNLWGLDYDSINEKIKSMKTWNGREYWDFVAKCDTGWDRLNTISLNRPDIAWCYFNVRGVHPARFLLNYNLFIADKIFKNKTKFFGKNNYYLDTYEAPYFTNNIFISETQYWKKTIETHYQDGFDEGQLSLRMLMDESSVLYVRNGFGIHMAYGMTENFPLIERTYIGNI